MRLTCSGLRMRRLMRKRRPSLRRGWRSMLLRRWVFLSTLIVSVVGGAFFLTNRVRQASKTKPGIYSLSPSWEDCY